MRVIWRILAVPALCAACWLPVQSRADNLCANGDFSKITTAGLPEDWVSDFAWMERSHWTQNEKYVKVLPKEGPKRGVLALTIGAGTDESTLASKPIPYEPGREYEIKFEGRTDTPQPRIYIRGYKWKSGIRPHPDPHLGELQDIYRGKPFDKLGRSWKRYSRKFPYFSKKQSSELALKHLKKVRFIVFYVVIPGGGTSPGFGTDKAIFIDNVVVRKK